MLNFKGSRSGHDASAVCGTLTYVIGGTGGEIQEKISSKIDAGAPTVLLKAAGVKTAVAAEARSLR
jgi:hypothetical protein